MDEEYLARLEGTDVGRDTDSSRQHRPLNSQLTSENAGGENTLSPSRSTTSRYGDRFIPVRAGALSFVDGPGSESTKRTSEVGSDATREDMGKTTYNLLLRNEVLGANATSPTAGRQQGPLSGPLLHV